MGFTIAEGGAKEMRVELLSTPESLTPLFPQWNCLTRGVPFRRWEWLTSWWKHYGQGRELFVVAVFDDGGSNGQEALVGLAPWFVENTASRGRVIQFLGSGDVCSDYLSLLTTPEYEESATIAIAQWMTNAAVSNASLSAESKKGVAAVQTKWDLLQLSGVASDDSAMALFAAHMNTLGAGVHRQRSLDCWRIDLDDWDAYLMILSKTWRKRLRKIVKSVLTAPSMEFETFSEGPGFDAAWNAMVDLHQRRRQALGEPGCFASSSFTGFLREAADQMRGDGSLQIHLLKIDGQPAAAELHLQGGGVSYAYQSGMAPELIDQQPGHLCHIAAFREALARGQIGYDLCRGSEEYKQRWRPRAQAMRELRIVAPRTGPKIRHGVWLAGDTMKNWVKSGLHLTGMR